MGEYIFRFPANTPELTHAALDAAIGKLCDRPNCRSCELRIGTTVRVRRMPLAVAFRLYDTDIAYIYPGWVEIPQVDDGRQATAAWLDRILNDNGIGGRLWRIRRHKADGRGPAVARGEGGLLTISGDRERPVFGRTYPVDHGRIAANRAERARWEAMKERERAGRAR